MKKPLGIAVIGAGLIGTLRCRAIERVDSLRLLGVADVDVTRARRAAGKTRAVADYRELLGIPDLDAVIVSTPLPLHAEIAHACLAAGRHVLCEKPLAATPEACERLVAAATAADRHLAVGFNHRYFPSVRFLRQAIAAGRIGRLDHLRVFAGHDGPHNFRADWMYRGELSGGGAMMDLGLHMTDLVRHLAGEIVEVYGHATDRVWHVSGSEDNALVLMRTGDGVPISYQATWSEWRGYRFRLEAYGDRGMASASYGPMIHRLLERDPQSGRTHHSWSVYPALNLREKLAGWQTTAIETFAAELADFARAIDGESTMLADGDDGRAAVAIAHAVYESSRRGAAVLLPKRDPPPR